MPLFKYKVSDESGKVSDLLVDGDSQTDAARRIQRRGLVPLEFLGEGNNATPRAGWFRPGLNVVDFTDRLVPLLEANIPLERALGILGEGHDNPQTTEIINELRRGLHAGRKLSDLIRERGRMFPQLYAGIVEAGEEAGALPQVMGELRKFMTEAQELRSFIISSSVYPAFIAGSALCMLAFILGVIIPRFASAIAGAGIDSAATDFLLGLSHFLRSYWWIFPLLAAAVAWLILQVQREEGPIRRAYDIWILKVPLAGKMVLYANLARLARTMAILMRSGVHLLNTVSIANRVVQNSEIRRSLQELSAELRQGQRLSAALGKSRHIPAMMLRMIAVGEETGAVENMLERTADRYEIDLRRLIKSLLSLFEPLVIIALGLAVGLIVLLMFMAIMDMQATV